MRDIPIFSIMTPICSACAILCLHISSVFINMYLLGGYIQTIRIYSNMSRNTSNILVNNEVIFASMLQDN